MFIQARMVGKTSHAGNLVEHVPTVDKAIDVGPKEKQATPRMLFCSTGYARAQLLVLTCYNY